MPLAPALAGCADASLVGGTRQAGPAQTWEELEIVVAEHSTSHATNATHHCTRSRTEAV